MGSVKYNFGFRVILVLAVLLLPFLSLYAQPTTAPLSPTERLARASERGREAH